MSSPMTTTPGINPADLGKFRVNRWMKPQEIVLPDVCVACGAEHAWRSMKAGGSDMKGKYRAWLRMPLCEHCADINDECDHLLGTRGKPREVKSAYRQIQRSTAMRVKRGFSGDILVNLTFRNRRFHAAFLAANPVPEKRHWLR
jgi:hypothetical protein